jgi:hypothetical protein
MMTPLSEIAIQLIESGLSIIPTNADKTPAIPEWTSFQKNIPHQAKVKTWFSRRRNIAAIAGNVSGGLEILDFDCQAEALPKWTQYVKERSPGLLEKLILELSPNGSHAGYRCLETTIPGNTKLARKAIEVKGPGEHSYKGKRFKAQQVNGKWLIIPELIETRGEGGYCLIYPSKGYELKQGDFLSIPTITAEERNILIEAARVCNEWTPPQEISKGYQPRQGEKMPGEDFDERGDLRGLLEKHDWTFKRTGNDGREQWARPGKSKGHSATLTDGKIFYCFSSNGQPFESGKGYGPFAVYATLEHNGDFSEASRALSEQGYGTRGYDTKPGAKGAPSMADLKLYMDFNIDPGQFFTAEEVCRGLGAYKKEQKAAVYRDLSRLVQQGDIKKDKYKHGGFRRVLDLQAYDLDGDIEAINLFNLELPLDLHNLVSIEPNQLVAVSGRYDAGKSAFLFHVMALNYRQRKIVHFSSPEWHLGAIKKRLDELGIPRPHSNVACYPMQEGYEDLIPPEPCIVAVDYIRTNDSPYEIDRQFHRIFQNLQGGVCIAAIQKHPGIDRPTGGQFAIHAPHHVVLLDKLKDSAYICKIFKTKSERDLEGLYRTFGFKEGRRLVPYMEDWKKGEIKFSKSNDTNDSKPIKAIKPIKKDDSNGGGPHGHKEIYKEREKKESKKRERKAGDSEATGENHNLFSESVLKTNGDHIEGEI